MKREQDRWKRALVLLSAVAIALGVASCSGTPATTGEGASTSTARTSAKARPSLYKDKNGYFSFAPPTGWTRKDYPNDPRSKVEFDCPTAEGVLVRLIAEVASPDLSGSNIVEAVRTQMEKARERLGPAVKMKIREGSFAGVRSAFAESSLPGQMEQQLRIFVVGSILFNIAYSAPNRATLEKYRAVAERSLDTLVFGRNVNIDPTSEAAQKQFVARHLRLAQMFAAAGDFNNARASLEDALQRYPKDTNLKRALELVMEKRPIPEDLGGSPAK